MKKLMKSIYFWLNAARLHTAPTSLLSWLFPFIFGAIDGGNIALGLLAMIGIVSAHLGVNLLDDVYDYSMESKRVSTKLEMSFNKRKGKCRYMLEGGATLKQTIFATISLFSVASIIGLYLTIECGWQVLVITIIAAISCIFYPFSTKFGLGEVTVGIVYAPLLCLGTYFVMTKSFSIEVLLISISTGLLTVGLLHTSTMLDYDFDVKGKKITICTLVGNKENAVIAQGVIMALAYLNIILWVVAGILPKIMLISLLTIPTSISLYKLLLLHIKDPEITVSRTFWMGPMENWKAIVENKMDSYMIKFLLSRNVMMIFTLLICIAKVISGFTGVIHV